GWGGFTRGKVRRGPAGKSGSLVTPLAEFCRYFADGRGHLWERQSLTRARPVCGAAEVGASVMAAVADAAFGPLWRPEFAAEIAAMREKMEDSRDRCDV